MYNNKFRKFARRYNRYRARRSRGYSKRHAKSNTMNLVSKQGFRFKPSSGLRMPTFTMSRQMQYIFNPSALSLVGPNNGNWVLCTGGSTASPGIGACLTDITVLNEFTGAADLTRLFRQYKIGGIKYEFFPSVTNVIADNTDTSDGILLRCTPNTSGIKLTGADRVEAWMQKSAVRRFALPNQTKTTIYAQVNQTDLLKEAAEGDPAQYNIKKSRWIPTDYYDLEHYALDFRIDSLDSTNLGDPNIKRPSFTVIKTVYFQTRGLI